MAHEFLQFLQKTNALALALAVIIGAAVGKVVTSIVNDLLMPVFGLWIGGGDWRSWQVPIKHAGDGAVLSAVRIGSFLGVLVDFVIIALCVFLITKVLVREAPAPPAPPTKTCGACGETILARATRCKYCTSPA